MRILLLSIGVLMTLQSSAQRCPIKKHVKLDTLFVDLQMNEAISEEFRLAIKRQTDLVVAEFNKEDWRKIKVSRASGHEDRTLHIEIDKMGVAAKSAQTWTFITSMVGLIALPVTLLAANAGYVSFFFATSINRVKGRTYTSDDLKRYPTTRPRKAGLNSNGGWFHSEAENKEEIRQHYKDRLYFLLASIDGQAN